MRHGDDERVRLAVTVGVNNSRCCKKAGLAGADHLELVCSVTVMAGE